MGISVFVHPISFLYKFQNNTSHIINKQTKTPILEKHTQTLEAISVDSI